MIINPYALGAAAPDPDFASVKLLMHMEGSNGGTTFTDVIGHTGTNTTGTNSTTQVKFGATSRFNNGGRYVISHADMALGAGAFTVECWAYCTSLANMGLFSNADETGVGRAAFGLNSSGTMSIYANDPVNSVATLTANAWHHLAFTRRFISGTLTAELWYDGVNVISVANSQNYTATLAYIGRHYDDTFAWTGYIDDFRITVGVGRYTGTFTPPVAAFPDS